MSREWTPTLRREGGSTLTVKRCCNGCLRELGDANGAELDAAMAGDQLPDSTVECGCDLDQPPGITTDSTDQPPLAGAAERIVEFLKWFGDGRVTGDITEGGPPLYARDLQVLAVEALATHSEGASA